MKLSTISEGSPRGSHFIDTGGVRDPEIEKRLGQLPHRDWKSKRRLPSLKKLRYAAQLSGPWPEFEAELPRIFRFLSKEFNWYEQARVYKPAVHYLTMYYLHSGSKPPPEFWAIIQSPSLKQKVEAMLSGTSSFHGPNLPNKAAQTAAEYLDEIKQELSTVIYNLTGKDRTVEINQLKPAILNSDDLDVPHNQIYQRYAKRNTDLLVKLAHSIRVVNDTDEPSGSDIERLQRLLRGVFGPNANFW